MDVQFFDEAAYFFLLFSFPEILYSLLPFSLEAGWGSMTNGMCTGGVLMWRYSQQELTRCHEQSGRVTRLSLCTVCVVLCYAVPVLQDYAGKVGLTKLDENSSA